MDAQNPSPSARRFRSTGSETTQEKTLLTKQITRVINPRNHFQCTFMSLPRWSRLKSHNFPPRVRLLDFKQAARSVHFLQTSARCFNFAQLSLLHKRRKRWVFIVLIPRALFTAFTPAELAICVCKLQHFSPTKTEQLV